MYGKCMSHLFTVLRSESHLPILLVVLGLYLFLSAERRRRVKDAWESLKPGNAFNTSTIAPNVQRVREDHLSRVPARHHPDPSQQVAAARQTVATRSYFQRQNSESEFQHPEA